MNHLLKAYQAGVVPSPGAREGHEGLEEGLLRVYCLHCEAFIKIRIGVRQGGSLSRLKSGAGRSQDHDRT